MTPPATLIFDLDGTLSEPAQGIGRSINFALAAHRFEPIDETTVSRFIGPPLDETFRTITGLDSPALIRSLVDRYRERYAEVGYAENALYPGIAEALHDLSNRGCVLGVCTSKRGDFAEQILQLFELRELFAFVSGGDIGISKHQQLERLLAEGVVSPASTMIGDRSVDIVAARGNGLSSVGVLWGHGSEPELVEAGAEVILRHVAELSTLARGIARA
ncbi:MAG: HAD hydrolase-like protein [Pseudomonadales bacterium]